MPMRPSLPELIQAATVVGGAMLALPPWGSAVMAQDDDLSIYFVGCAAPTGFHGYLARGAEEAGQNLGVKVTYIYPDALTIPNQVQKIEEAIAAQSETPTTSSCSAPDPTSGPPERSRRSGSSRWASLAVSLSATSSRVTPPAATARNPRSRPSRLPV